jgi:NAD(P)-dependent dehydrogenase (short-subunit alcohol dehydrogenase family)
MSDLSGRRVVITGASRGLGRAMAVAAAEAGAYVIATGRDEEALAETLAVIAAAGGDAEGIALDVRDAEAVEAAAERAGHVDGLVNNAGVAVCGPAVDTTPEQLGHLLDTNVVGTFNCCRSFGRRMLDAGGGTIVNVASDIGMRGVPMWSAYSASKGAVIALSKTLAWEWAPQVRVNVLSPGAFETDINRDLLLEPGVRDAVVADTPLARLGDVEEVGPLTVFLLGDGANFMTGAVVPLDGGIRRA